MSSTAPETSRKPRAIRPAVPDKAKTKAALPVTDLASVCAGAALAEYAVIL